MLLCLFEVGIDRPVHLFWGARAKKDLYLEDEINAWMKGYPQLQFTPVLSDPEASDQWQGETGWVHDVVALRYSTAAKGYF